MRTFKTTALTDAHPCPCSKQFACGNCRIEGKRRLRPKIHAGELAVFCQALLVRRYHDVEVTEEMEMVYGVAEALRRVRLHGVLEFLEGKWAGEDRRRALAAS